MVSPEGTLTEVGGSEELSFERLLVRQLALLI